MFSAPLLALAQIVLADAREAKLRIATAESCTGGLIGALLTEIPGSSEIFDRGFIVYSNRAKSDMLNVPGDLIADMGAVSEAVARAMAEGAVENSNAHVAVAVTGVAGPGGGTRMKPQHASAARSCTRPIASATSAGAKCGSRPWKRRCCCCNGCFDAQKAEAASGFRPSMPDESRPSGSGYRSASGRHCRLSCLGPGGAQAGQPFKSAPRACIPPGCARESHPALYGPAAASKSHKFRLFAIKGGTYKQYFLLSTYNSKLFYTIQPMR